MKTNKKNNAFTLIEMVGVLAVIAILAALLVPKIFAAINDSRFSNTVASINSVKTATMSYFGKVGSFPAAGTVTFDTLLVTTNCMERPLACKIATGASAQVQASLGTTAGTTYCYSLDGTTTIPAGSTVVECVLTNVAAADALELSTRIDGAGTLSPGTSTTGDTLGRVIYANPVAGLAEVHVYIAHK